MTRIEKVKQVLIHYLGSRNKYRIQEIKSYNLTYDRWDTTFTLQVRVAFLFWMNITAGYYTCEKAYSDLIRCQKVPKKIKRKKVMSKSDLILEMLKDE